MKKKMLIQYVFKHEKDESGMVIPHFTSKYVETDNCKRYSNSMQKTALLSPASRNLLDYLIERMNTGNEVENSSLLKMEFVALMKKACGVSYSDETINKSFQELKKAELLVSFERKGVYIVNPLYFFRGSEEKRKKLLQKMLNAIPEGKYSGTNLANAMGVAA